MFWLSVSVKQSTVISANVYVTLEKAVIGNCRISNFCENLSNQFHAHQSITVLYCTWEKKEISQGPIQLYISKLLNYFNYLACFYCSGRNSSCSLN